MRPLRTTTTPTEHTLVRSLLAVSKSMAAKSLIIYKWLNQGQNYCFHGTK
jgi:hypothetical protein